MILALYISSALIACALGLHSGPSDSRKFLAICLVMTVLCAPLSQLAVHTSDEPSWAASGLIALPGIAGLCAVLSTLALIGPSLFRTKILAIATSVILLSLFSLTMTPFMWTACVLYSLCV